jgi:3-phenylpropionate/trans-cinnamate dioxygenase ferredoxin reductase component
MQAEKIVIVGAGQAASQAIQSLRQGGFAGQITLIGAESVPPYQRPPLSKAYLSGAMSLDRVILKPLEALIEEKVNFIAGQSVTAINPAVQTVTLEDGTLLPWDRLILATGSRVRKIPAPGANQGGIHYLRSIADADGLSAEMALGQGQAKRLVVVGGGYIGLEVAAVARKAGLAVTVVEAMERVLARVTTPEISAFYEKLHGDAGVLIKTKTGVTGFLGQNGWVTDVTLNDGTSLPADLVLVGIGIVPNSELAKDAGLNASDGIETDEDARTSHPHIYAIGDCASRPLVHYGHRRGRLESVHNALEQAKFAAASIVGLPRPTEETPWFWSDQYDVKLQIAGLSAGCARTVLRGDPLSKKFAAFHLADDHTLLGVDAVNAPPEFLVGKQLIARHAKLAPATLADMSISMKEIGAKA